jgi:hypothetical protein
MDDKQHEFTLREFDALRSEIAGYFAELRKLEVYAALATAVVDSFLISLERDKGGQVMHVPNWAWALPIAFPVLALIRGQAFNKQIVLIASYIQEIETAYDRIPIGWEHKMKMLREKEGAVLDRSSGYFASALILFSLLVLAWKLTAA